MAVILTDGTTQPRVEPTIKAHRHVVVPRGSPFGISSVTGTIAAAAGANSCFFAMRNSLSAGTTLVFFERLRIQFTTIVAFTTAVTAGRRLALYRGSGAATSGGTAIALANPKDSTGAISQCNSAAGGDIRIATTGGLTTTGITWDTNPFRTLTLTHVGAAGGFAEALFEFHATECAPIILQPGQVLGVLAPQAMDAAGTWQLGVNADWYEALALSA